jgi:glycosyltransferase involved in cell wall biosynthesis
MNSILYVITRSEHGGAQIHVRDLVAGFKDRFNIHVAVGDQGFLTRGVSRLGATVHQVTNLTQPINPLKDILAVRELIMLMRRIRPQLVHTHSTKAGLVGRLAARSVGIPVVFTAHGWAFSDGVPVHRKILGVLAERVATRWATQVITVSQYDRLLAQRYKLKYDNNFHVIHNGIPSILGQTYNGETSIIQLVMVARFTNQKDHAIVLQALQGIEHNVQICLVGDGPTRPRIERLAEQLGISDRVKFVGWRDDVHEILASANIYVLASNWEGLPICLLEAMRAGLPIVTSDVGGVREVIVDGETGFLVDRGDVAMLRDRLQRLLSDPELRNKMGKAGRKRYLEHFTVERMLDQTLQVYENAIKKIF